MFEENKKIGLGLAALGAACGLLGIFMMLDRVLMSMANIFFVLGLILTLGWTKTTVFFFRPEKFIGSFLYFSGMAAIFAGYVLIGSFVQFGGVWMLFSSFLPQVVQSIKLTPLGVILDLPGISWLVRWINDQRRLPL